MLQFSRRDVLQNTDFDPAAIENRRLVWTFSFEAAGSKAEGSISYHVISLRLLSESKERKVLVGVA